jgi:phosphohistidine phosphatase
LKILYLLRHAKSSWDNPALEDHDRPLARRGMQAAARMGSYFALADVRPDLVLCSSAARATQTIEAIDVAIGIGGFLGELKVEGDLYGVGAAGLLARLQDLPETVGSALVIGHNPALQDLAIALAGHGDRTSIMRLRDKFPTCALATLTMTATWADLGAGQADLASLVAPADLAVEAGGGSSHAQTGLGSSVAGEDS